MPVTSRCPNCEKSYDLADKWLGRTVKCAACGQAFRVAEGVGEAASARAAAGEEPTSTDTIDWSLLAPDIEKGPNLGLDTTVTDGDAESRLMKASPRAAKDRAYRESRGMSGERVFAGPPPKKIRRVTGHSAFIDSTLPAGLCLIGYGTSVLFPLVATVQDPLLRAAWWQALLAMAGIAALYALIIVPISSIGPVLTAKMLRFELPEGTLFRMFAIFATPTVVSLVLQFGLRIPPDEVRIIGAILLLPILFVGHWLLYHMRVHEALVGTVMTLVCTIGAGFVAFVVIMVVAAVLGLHESPWSRQRAVADQPSPRATDRPGRPGPNDPTATRVNPDGSPAPVEPVDPITYDIQQLGETEAVRRRLAARSFATMLPYPTRRVEVIAALEARLDDPDESVTSQALEALLVWDEPSAIDALKKNVASDSLTLRRQAIEELSKRKVFTVAKAIADRLPVDGHMVVEPLIRFGPEAERWVLPYLSHDSALTRRYAMQVIAEIGSAESIAPVRRLIDDPDATTAESARKTLHRIAPQQFDAVAMALYDLQSSQQVTQLRGIETLMEAEPDDRRAEVSAALIELITGPYDAVREPAAEALARWHDSMTVTTLIGYMDERGDRTIARQGAMMALGKMSDPAGADAVTRWIALDAEHAVPALIEMGPVVEPAMLRALRNRDARARIAAAAVLKEVGGRGCLAALHSAAQLSGDDQARAAAADAHAAVPERVRNASEAASPE